MSSSSVEFSIQSPRDAYRDRRPPWSEDAEQAVLAAMLIDQDAILRATEHVDDTMFYREGHRRIFRAMVAISERGDVVDPLTLSDELQRRGELEPSGGKDYIGFLVDAVPTAANVEYHAKIVREKALLRRLIEASTDIVAEAFDARQTAGELLDHAESRIFEISQQRGREGFTRIKELLWPTMERIEALQRGGKTVTGVPTGFADLDGLTNGLHPGQLIVIAGRPGLGKSTLGLDIARAASVKHAMPSAIFSLEMSKTEITMRLLSAEARVPLHHMRSGTMTDDDWTRLARRMPDVSAAPLYIDDSPNLSMMEIRAKCRRLKQRSNLQLVVIDYLQLMQSGGSRRPESRQQEVSDMSRNLKLLAKELEVPVIALSQLNRGPEQRTDKKPMVSDLRESGSIEQDADMVILLHREDAYEKESPRAGEADLIVAKHRNGPTATITVAFQGHYSRFVDMANT
jgi:replicative DNA helicase